MSNLIKHILIFGITAIIFFAIDLLWLGIIAKDLYARHLGSLMADQTNWIAALIFYSIYIFGILYFIVYPNTNESGIRKVIINAGLLGFLMYSTFELTALAVLKDWPLGLVWIDISWGIVLTSTVSALSFITAKKLNL